MANLGITDSKQPDHTVVNLLATMIFAGVNLVNNKQIPECPVKPVATIRERLNEIPQFKTARELTTALKALSTPARDVRYIWRRYCTCYWELKISGMPAAVHQFIVAKNVPELQESFDAEMKRSKSQSRLLFHGTDMHFLLPILRQGFKPSVGGLLFMAEEPICSYGYAFKLHRPPPAQWHCPAFSEWANSPFKKYGVLLACEAAGINASPNGIHGVQTTANIRAVAVRYVLLIEGPPGQDPKAPAFSMGK
jgi:hypothetical protein